MDFNCNIKIVDALMGAGKTTSAIRYINNSVDEKFLYITPFLTEVKRIKECCSDKKFKEPEVYGTKFDGIKYLIEKGENVVSTHSLFHKFDQELIDMCRSQNYTLIMDEVTDVIEPYPITKQDFDLLMEKYVYVDKETNLIRWRDDADDYTGKFIDEKRLCEFGCLAFYGNSVMMWLFPISVFDAFRNTFILTYMFEAQIQKYYYDFHGLPYSYIYVKGDNITNYEFTNEPIMVKKTFDYKSHIHICDNEKLNQIGDRPYDLCLNWYRRNGNENNVAIKKLKNNIYNYFCNVRETKSRENLWTVYSDYKGYLSGKGYGRSFLSHTARSTNDYRNRTSIAYPINKFMNAYIKTFFEKNGIKVDEDGYSTSEMLQFLWRSAIRDGKEIWVYIPSVRMRNLLEQWIETNSA